MLESVTNKSFFKEMKHEPYRMRLVSTKSSTPPPSPPPSAPSAHRLAPKHMSSSRGSPSFIKNALKAIFNVCTHNATNIKEHQDKTNLRLRKIEERQKAIYR